jgi:hypothetical protein
MRAGAGGVECELADRDPHSSYTEIAQPEDALTVRYDDKADVLLRPVAENLTQAATRADRQVHAACFTEDPVELLTCLTDRRRIDQRHEARRVRHQNRIVQRLVANLEVRQQKRFLQVVIEIGQLGVNPRNLEFEGRADGRQDSFHAGRAPLCLAERCTLVQPRIVKKAIANSGILYVDVHGGRILDR